ncbi:hypothetical protein ACOSQ2_032176 [Xanthoceras sorbifolium]
MSNKMHISYTVNDVELCESSKYGKLHQLHFPSTIRKTTAPLDLIFSDIWGPSLIASTNGHKYYIVFVDSYTRFSWTFSLPLKSEALPTFISFQKQVELQFNTKIKAFQSDMGSDFWFLS